MHLSNTTVAEKQEKATPITDLTAAQITQELGDLKKTQESVEVEALAHVFEERRAKLLRQLKRLTSADRNALQEKISKEHGEKGLNYKVVTDEEYEKALTGKVSDPRAEALMKGAPDMDVKLEEGEIVVIKKGSGVDGSVSDTLSKQFKSQLTTLGVGFRIMASRGSVRSGTRGDLSALVDGTTISKNYQKKDYEAVIETKDGKKVIRGTKGEKFAGETFDSLSGAGAHITNYSVRGPQWWIISAQPESTNGASKS